MTSVAVLTNSPVVPEAPGLREFFAQLKPQVDQCFRNHEYSVIGEVERVTPYLDHFYVTLAEKSSDSPYPLQLTVFVRGVVAKTCPVEKGMKLLATGSISLNKNAVMLRAERLMDVGTGELVRLIAQWEKAYQDVFAREKRQLTGVVCRIGLIAGEDTHGYRDFISHLEYGRVILAKTKMQGASTAQDVAAAIDDFNAESSCDAICIVRGGGSFTDLFDFNRPEILTAISRSRIPVVTGIGHENDYPLCDRAADVRCATPTAAAQFFSAQTEQVLSEVRNAQKCIQSSAISFVANMESQIAHARNTLRYATQGHLDSWCGEVSRLRQRLKDGFSAAKNAEKIRKEERERHQRSLNTIIIAAVLLLLVVAWFFFVQRR